MYIARFARNVECDFFGDFQKLYWCVKLLWIEKKFPSNSQFIIKTKTKTRALIGQFEICAEKQLKNWILPIAKRQDANSQSLNILYSPLPAIFSKYERFGQCQPSIYTEDKREGRFLLFH